MEAKLTVGCADQILEMAQYIDARKGAQVLVSELEILLEKGEKEEALKKIVDASGSLSTSPEKGTPFSSHFQYQIISCVDIATGNRRIHPRL